MVIYKLDRQDYYKVKSLLEPAQRNNVTLNAIINGINRGAIYVDDREEPTTALVDETGIISLFIGDVTNQAFLDALPEFIDNQLKMDTYESCGGTYFIAVVQNNQWGKALEKAIANKAYEIDNELYYHFVPEMFHSLKKHYKTIPDNLSLKRINNEVIRNDPDGILKGVLEEVWYKLDDFHQDGFGYCITKGHSILSACFSCCVYENQHEISVETFDDTYMNKGLATLVCAAYLEHCIKNDLVPHWSTMDTNQGSKRLANKLGFVYESKLTTYEFEWI